MTLAAPEASVERLVKEATVFLATFDVDDAVNLLVQFEAGEETLTVVVAAPLFAQAKRVLSQAADRLGACRPELRYDTDRMTMKCRGLTAIALPLGTGERVVEAAPDHLIVANVLQVEKSVVARVVGALNPGRPHLSWLTSFFGHAAPVFAAGPECQTPPPGWRCTRGAGHDGPCAAWPAMVTP